jgi:hypothetical protein
MERPGRQLRLFLCAELFILAVLLLGFSGCGSSGMSNSQSGAGPQASTINGTQITSYIAETGTTGVPDDLSSTTIAAYLPNGVGGYTLIPGSGDGAGHFTVPATPTGYYLLQIGSNYFWTNSITMDTGTNAQGRSNSLNGINAQLQFNVNLTIPTQPTDDFVMYAPNVSHGFDYYPQYPQPQTVFDYLGIWEAPQLDSSQGDRSYLLHLKAPFAPFTYGLTLNEEMTGPLSLNVTNGSTTNVQAFMSAAGASFRANFKGSAFVAFAPQMMQGGYSTQYGSLYVGVEAVPPQATQGGVPPSLGNVGVLATFDYPADPSTPDTDEGNVAYANSFPANYSTVFFADLQVSKYYYTQAVFPTSLTAQMLINTLTPITDTQPLAPVLSPVTGLTLDGNDIFGQSATNISAQPTARWNPPALGTPNFYRIQVIHIYATQNRQYSVTAADTVAQIQTSANSLLFPPNLLSPASQYVLRVTACSATSSNITSAPLRWTYPFACTDALSSTFTTAGP